MLCQGLHFLTLTDAHWPTEPVAVHILEQRLESANLLLEQGCLALGHLYTGNLRFLIRLRLTEQSEVYCHHDVVQPLACTILTLLTSFSDIENVPQERWASLLLDYLSDRRLALACSHRLTEARLDWYLSLDRAIEYQRPVGVHLLVSSGDFG